MVQIYKLMCLASKLIGDERRDASFEVNPRQLRYVLEQLITYYWCLSVACYVLCSGR